MEQEREATDWKVGRQGEGELTARACMRMRTVTTSALGCVYTVRSSTPAPGAGCGGYGKVRIS